MAFDCFLADICAAEHHATEGWIYRSTMVASRLLFVAIWEQCTACTPEYGTD